VSISSITDLFDSAADEGAGMSQASVGLMVNNLNANTMLGAQGASADDLAGDQVTLFVEIIDKSGSMGVVQDTVIHAYNEQVRALKASKMADSILMSTWTFSTRSELLHGYLPLDSVPDLSRAVYSPDDLTALYDAILDAFTSVVAYAQTLIDAGIQVKVVVVVLTDGQNNASRHSAAAVATIAADLLKKEYYTLALVAFGVDGLDIAREIGFPTANVMDEDTDASSIRRALGTISTSVIRTSQTLVGAQGSQSFFS